MSDELKPCPFCGGGETHIVDNGRVWNGTKHSDPVSVSVRHWCAKMPGQPSRAIERVGRDEQSAIKAWNMRADDTLRTQLAAMTAERDAFSQQALDLIAKRDSAMARVAVLDLLDSGEWTLTRVKPLSALTAEANANTAWMVTRTEPPFCDWAGNRHWSGKTAAEAMMAARNALEATK